MNSCHSSINFGALCSLTGKYTLPTEANKKGTYQCIGCKDKVFVRQGERNRHHFCHYPTSQCTYYAHSSESEIHKNAKMRIKSLFDQKCDISFLRSCISCESKEQSDIFPLSDTLHVELEYRFKMTGTEVGYVADVACIEDERPICMIEIYHTHKTSKERRVEPWFEVNAIDVLHTKINNNKIELQCIRKEECDECIPHSQKVRYTSLCSSSISSMTDSDLEFYVRYHLGQRIFGYIDHYNTETNTYHRSYAALSDDPYHPNKFSYDGDEDKNDRIINMFSDKIKNHRAVVRGRKGMIEIAILPKNDTNPYPYRSYLPNSTTYNSGGSGTRIKIIMDILRLTNKVKKPTSISQYLYEEILRASRKTSKKKSKEFKFNFPNYE